MIRATLSMSVRYGDTTLDLPSLQAWLRARIGGRWQPPTLVKVQHIAPTGPKRVQGIISAHPGDYASPDDWQAQAVEAMKGLVPYSFQGLLSEMLTPEGKMVTMTVMSFLWISCNLTHKMARAGSIKWPHFGLF